MHTTLLLLMLIPLGTPWIVKMIFPKEIKWPELAVTIGVTAIVTVVVYFAGIAGATRDHEIWNGLITSKDRVHGEYTESYSCNCHEVCSGSGNNRSCSEECDTCYREHYTVKWTAHSTLKDFLIDSRDSLSTRVYSTPNPQRYTIIQNGDPCSTSNSFTNYIKAAPDSLLHANPLLKSKFEKMIPPYPGEIFDIYKINRVLSVGVSVPDLQKWNTELSLILRTLGPNKQANAVIVFVNTDDQSYQLALENAWLGGKKNDIVVIIGTTHYPAIDWVGVTSWTNRELFKVQLRDEIFAQKTVDREMILASILKHTNATFVRRQMKEFEYLKDDIEPPLWVIILAVIFSMGTCGGLSYWFFREDPFSNGNNFNRSYRGRF